MRRIITCWMYCLTIVMVIAAVAGAEHSPLSLAEALRIGLLNNPRIHQAKEYRQSTDALKESAKTAFLPKIFAGYAYTHLDQEPYSAGSGYPIPVANKTQYEWQLSLRQPVFTGFATTANYRIADLNTRISRSRYHMTVIDVARDVKHAFFDLLLAAKIHAVAQSSKSNLGAHVKDAEHLYTQGMIPYNDLLRARVGLAHATQQAEKAWAGKHLADLKLKTVLNLSLNDPIHPSDIISQPPEPDWIDGFERKAIAGRPELSALTHAFKQLEEKETIAISSRYPQVSLLGQYEQRGTDPAATENDIRNSYNSTIRIQADWALFEWGKSSRDRASIAHEKEALHQEMTRVENQIRLDANQAYTGLQVARANIHTAQKAMGQARENWRITNVQYQQQTASSTEVLDAQLYMNRLDSEYYQSLYGYMKALASLERAVGLPDIDKTASPEK